MQEDKKIQEMKQDIQQLMAKKDYYQTLGISKTDTDVQIKKAYKRLALRFHPDKNKVEGAIDVFKKVTNAYSTLIDPTKREHYDKFGPQQQRKPKNNHTNNNNYANQDFNQYDEVFRHFFQHNFNQAQGQQDTQQKRSGFGMLTTFGFFWLLFKVISYFLMPSEIFSLTPSSIHTHRLESEILKANYYVEQSFFKNLELKKDVDLKVDALYLGQLKSSCDTAKNTKVTLQYEAYQYPDNSQRIKLIEKARNVDLSSCKTLEELQAEHSDYIRDLVHPV